MGLIFLPLKIYWRVRLLFLTDIILFMVFVIFLLWRDGKFKLLALLSCAILGLLAVYGTSTAIRHSAKPGLEKLSKAADGFIEFVSTGKIKTAPGTAEFGRLGSLTKRMSHIWVFNAVDNKSPDPVPYWRGKTYRPLFTSFIPRVIYPDKPEERSGGGFGRRYGFLDQHQAKTSLNLPWVTEMLANFGPLGVVLGMGLAGMFLGFLDRLFNRAWMTDLEFTVGLTLIYPLVYPESNFSAMAGSMLTL
ncbi:MAG: hypothetical protein QGF09_16750, partial [Rhodospirillales bacterium]|nr:hypothetical protein [Rhodospirillales bacterium]